LHLAANTAHAIEQLLLLMDGVSHPNSTTPLRGMSIHT
jgi:hypothetical protein